MSDATDSRWIVVALVISKGDCTHLIESPPRLELGEARWRGAVGPRTSPWLSVQLLFARRAPLVRYAASSQACRKKLSPKYTSRARATSDAAKREGERKRAALDINSLETTRRCSSISILPLCFSSLSLYSSSSTSTRVKANSSRAVDGQTRWSSVWGELKKGIGGCSLETVLGRRWQRKGREEEVTGRRIRYVPKEGFEESDASRISARLPRYWPVGKQNNHGIERI